MRLLFFTLIVAAATVTKAGQVVLTSDPPGASIYAGDKQLGTTPLTMDLPSGPTVLTSRFGSLTPVTETVTSDEEQASSFNFQHAYGILIVSSDREDAELTIDAAAFGHPPALLFVTPGTHKVFLTAPNAPDKTRSVDVAQGQRASVEIHFSGPSPETITRGPGPSPSPARSNATPTPTPKSSSEMTVWQEPPPVIPMAQTEAKPSPEPKPSPNESKPARTQPVSTPLKRGRVALVSPSPTPTLDPAKAKAALETTLQAEKQMIDSQIANSSGAIREQWKYKLAVWRVKKGQAEQKLASMKSAVPAVTPAPKEEHALLESERKAKEKALAVEKQRIDYELANSSGAARKQWESKLALWQQEKAKETKELGSIPGQ
jgi:hypothetical protein